MAHSDNRRCVNCGGVSKSLRGTTGFLLCCSCEAVVRWLPDAVDDAAAPLPKGMLAKRSGESSVERPENAYRGGASMKMLPNALEVTRPAWIPSSIAMFVAVLTGVAGISTAILTMIWGSSLPFFITVGSLLAYIIIARLGSRRVVRLDRTEFVIRHEPFPLMRKTQRIDMSTVKAVGCRRFGEKGGSTFYAPVLFRFDDDPVNLGFAQDEPGPALAIAARLDQHLRQLREGA